VRDERIEGGGVLQDTPCRLEVTAASYHRFSHLKRRLGFSSRPFTTLLMILVTLRPGEGGARQERRASTISGQSNGKAAALHVRSP
jgi:hypothetical protein